MKNPCSSWEAQPCFQSARLTKNTLKEAARRGPRPVDSDKPKNGKQPPQNKKRPARLRNEPDNRQHEKMMNVALLFFVMKFATHLQTVTNMASMPSKQLVRAGCTRTRPMKHPFIRMPQTHGSKIANQTIIKAIKLASGSRKALTMTM